MPMKKMQAWIIIVKAIEEGSNKRRISGAERK
jgi:hypothetical protein